ncbi:MAG: class I SAM-dependent methyltransferase, partial [bacterium]
MSEIRNVSDTARWVAVYRAMETRRPDALFHDPFAAKLAGEKGEAIVATIPRGRQMAWAMIVRTKVFDEVILERVRSGNVDVVLNLAAGLDARPWRLTELPPTLEWIDVDLPGILDYKLDTLASEKTVCSYDAIRLDLTDGAKRRALFEQIGRERKRVLIVTEGLLIYLSEAQVGELARDLHEPSSFQWWLIDLISQRLFKMLSRQFGKQLAAGNAAFQFAPAASTKFFEPFGWRELDFRSSLDAAQRLKREMGGMWFWRLLSKILSSKQRMEETRRMSGCVVLERA